MRPISGLFSATGLCQALLIVAFAMSGSPTAEAKSAGSCLRGVRAPLLAGKASGPIDCEGVLWSSSRLVGHIVSGGRNFYIYSYTYTPICPECAIHGGRRFFVLRDGVYLGQYKSDFVSASVIGNQLILTPQDSSPPGGKVLSATKIPFSPSGPPAAVWVDGEVISLFK